MRIKICGITNVADALQAASLGADAVGLNFFQGSSRCINEGTAAEIVRSIPPFVEPVGLFVNEPLAGVLERVQQWQFLRTIQWHGDRHEVPPSMPYHFIPAFQVRDADGLSDVTAYLEQCRQCGRLPVAIVIDGHVSGAYGGTGQRAPWERLAGFQPGVPLILAGGLTPDNVAEAIRIVRPYGVDVAGGVESAPGRKDPEKMRRFIKAAREALTISH